jgi:RNA polymerase sigma-70 factor (ECF subfamily)
MTKTLETDLSQERTHSVDSQAWDDDALAETACQDPYAYAQLYDRYLKQVYRYFLLRLGQRQEAEDLTSQVFLAALEALPTYQSDGQFRAWLFGIARRKLADALRRRRPQVRLDEMGELPDADDAILAKLVHSDDLKRLALAFAGLKEHERELLSLRFGARLSFSEMARLLKRKESAVKMSVYRLLERLERQLEPQDER